MNPVINKPRHRLDSLPVMGQGYVHTTSETTTTIAIDMEKEKTCAICDYKTTSLQDFGKHLDEHHKPTCSKCENPL